MPTMRNSEEEPLIKKEEHHNRIPQRAIKTIAMSVILEVIGIICLSLLVLSFCDNTMYTLRKNRITLTGFMVLCLPSGFYTLFVAWKAYHNAKGYHWGMIYY